MQRPKANIIRAGFTASWLVVALTAVWIRVEPTTRSGPAAVASARRAAGDLDAAAAILLEAGALGSGDGQVLELLGGIELDRGELAAAEQAFRAAHAVDPLRPEAALGLADVLLRRRQSDAALAMLTPLKVADLNQAQRHRWLALIAETGDSAGLAQAAEATLAAAPDDADAWLYAFDAAERRHDWASAVRIGDRVAALRPERAPELLERVARAHEAAGDLEAALVSYRQTAEERTWLAQARLSVAVGQFDRAAHLFRTHAQELGESDREAAAFAAQQTGRAEEAEAHYGTLLASGRLSATGRTRYAWLLNTGHRYRQAWRVASSLPEDVEHLQLRAFTAAWAQQDAIASRLLTRWLRLHPRDRTADDLLADVRRRSAPGDPPSPHAQPATLADAARHAIVLGGFDEAIGLYRQALHAPDLSMDDRRELSADLARLLRWTGHAKEAVDVLRSAVGPSPAAPIEGAAQAYADLAWALADAGDWPEVATSVERAIQAERPGRPLDGALLILGARAATVMAQPAAAATYLERLAQVRPLTIDELGWLAGQSEEARRLPRALELYRALAAILGPDAVTWERIGDLEAARGNAAEALRAYRIAGDFDPSPRLSRKLTANALLVGDREAASAYDEALARADVDAEADLAAARFHAAAGRAEDALTWYGRYLAISGGDDRLHLELARINLAAGRPQAALEWARAGRGSADAPIDDLRFAEAQALHMLGRPRAAADILGALASRTPANGDILGWLARTAQARGRRLDAYLGFGEALARAGRPAGEMWLARGDLALAGGRPRSAMRNYDAAARAGAGESADVRRREAALQLRPLVSLPAERFSDSTGFTSINATGGFIASTASLGRITTAWSSGRVEQRQTSFDRSAVSVGLDRLYPSERLAVDAAIAVESAGDVIYPLWRARATRSYRSNGTISVEAFRRTPWTADASDARERYNRITDLARLTPSFHQTGVTAGSRWPVHERHEVQGHATFRQLSDGNRQTDAFAQYQVPVVAGSRVWAALQPYVYFEQSQRSEPAYFSPRHQTTLAMSARAIVTAGGWAVDASLAPQLLTSEARTGPGFSSVTSIRRQVRGGSVGASYMTFADAKPRYRLHRWTVEATIPVR